MPAALSFALGFRVHAGWGEALAAFGLCVLFGFAFAWAFLTLGLLTGNPQAAQGIGFLVLPLTFASSAYVPVSTMPGWLQAFAANQPVTVMVDAVRTLTQGAAAEALLGLLRAALRRVGGRHHPGVRGRRHPAGPPPVARSR